MSHGRRFAAFWWDFVVGDDWRVAVGLAVALLGTWVLSDLGVDAWWALPVAVSALLVVSVLREASRQAHGE